MAKKQIPKFWNFTKNPDSGERELFLDGDIVDNETGEAYEFWGIGDYKTPKAFKDELYESRGKLTLWLNSCGGSIVSASQIYTLLLDYPDEVIVKVSGIAASAASFLAMAGDKVYMSPTAVLFIHDPITYAYGYATDLKKAIEFLDEMKEAIINAYEIKTNLDRDVLSKMMSAETTMNANRALELGFIDGIIEPAETKGDDAKDTAKSKDLAKRDLDEKAKNKLKIASAINKITVNKTTTVTVEIDEDEDPKKEEKSETKEDEKEKREKETSETTTETEKTGETSTEEENDEDEKLENKYSIETCKARLELILGGRQNV